MMTIILEFDAGAGADQWVTDQSGLSYVDWFGSCYVMCAWLFIWARVVWLTSLLLFCLFLFKFILFGYSWTISIFIHEV